MTDAIVNQAVTNTMERLREETIGRYEAIIRDAMTCPKRTGALTEAERIRGAAVDIYHLLEKNPQMPTGPWADYLRTQNDLRETERRQGR